jgi:cell division protein FtsL
MFIHDITVELSLPFFAALTMGVFIVAIIIGAAVRYVKSHTEKAILVELTGLREENERLREENERLQKRRDGDSTGIKEA